MTTDTEFASPLPLELSGLTRVIYGASPECASDPDLFFGPDSFSDEPESCRVRRVEAARTLCAACPVRSACEAFALLTRPNAGVWAGYDADTGEIENLAAAGRRPVTVPAQVAA